MLEVDSSIHTNDRRILFAREWNWTFSFSMDQSKNEIWIPKMTRFHNLRNPIFFFIVPRPRNVYVVLDMQWIHTMLNIFTLVGYLVFASKICRFEFAVDVVSAWLKIHWKKHLVKGHKPLLLYNDNPHCVDSANILYSCLNKTWSIMLNFKSMRIAGTK